MDEVRCLTVGDFQVNCYFFAYGDNLVCVDPGDEGERLVHEIEALCKKYSLQFDSIFITHAHLDHVGALSCLKQKFPEVKIYANSKEKQMLGKGSFKAQYEGFSAAGMGSYVLQQIPDEKDLPEADEYVQNGQIVFGDWKILETPGHTKGSSCLYSEKRKIIFCGDTLFYRGFGRCDLAGGDKKELMDSLIFLSTLPRDIIAYPGHDYYGFELGKAYVFDGISKIDF